MDWGKCEREFIRSVVVDNERIESLKKMSMKRLKRAKLEKDVSFAVEDYYEVIKELLVAYLLKNGLKSNNHQCLFSYFLKKNSDLEGEVNLILQMSYFRNRLAYYGEIVPEDFFNRNVGEFNKIIKIILKLLD